MNTRGGNALVLLLLLGVCIVLGLWQASPWLIPEWSAARLIAAGVVLLGYAALCIAIWRRSRHGHVSPGSKLHEEPKPQVLVVYATQTGMAEQLARDTVASLAPHLDVRELPMSRLTAEHLAHASTVLFIASTTGEGDPPDMAVPFVSKVLTAPYPLSGLRHAVLALGDRTYEQFAAFGVSLDEWLIAQGSTPLFERVTVDNLDPDDLARWFAALGVLGAQETSPSVISSPFAMWQLQDRVLVNQGSARDPVLRVRLWRDGLNASSWSAGEIVQLAPDFDATESGELRDASQWREFSIATIPAENTMDLLVRMRRTPAGQLGYISHHLSMNMSIGDSIAVRVRANPGFAPPHDGRPLILIGNGTGIAGLRGILAQRIASGHFENWLMFGERDSRFDNFFHEDLERWLSKGELRRMDTVWSRNSLGEPKYVQSLVWKHRDIIAEWVGRGADIMVCGMRDGMANGVDESLRDILGDERIDSLIERAQYRRDVY